MKKQNCSRCGKRFYSKRKSAKFCSAACRVAYNRGSGSALRESYLDAIAALELMVKYLERNPEWQCDTDIIDIAREIQQFASRIDSNYEIGAKLMREDKELQCDKVWTDRDKSRYANFMLSDVQKYRCLTKDCGQIRVGRPMPNDTCPHCNKSTGWLKLL
jgi:hypothetical protein